MANLANISIKKSDEIVKISSTHTLCSNTETFDTTSDEKQVKKWQNKARRKFYTNHIANNLCEYEKTLPNEKRGKWNSKISYKYIEKTEITENNELRYAVNKFGLQQWEKTDCEKSYSTYYDHSNEIGNQLRWKRMLKCHNTIAKLVNSETGEEIYQATDKCNDKLCAVCSQIRSQIAIKKYMDKVDQMVEPVMVVLHQKSPEIGHLKECINEMYNDWRSILKIRTKNNQDNFNGICAIEITTNVDENTYHPHYHIIIEKAQAEELVKLWVNKRPNKRKIKAHIHKATGLLYSELPKKEDGKINIKELFKYAMKMSVSSSGKTENNKSKKLAKIEMIYEIAVALQGVQQWRPFGNFRNAPNNKEITKIIADEMTVNVTNWPHIELSEKWTWNQTQSDWEADDIKGLYLTGYKLTDRDIAFLRLSNEKQQTNYKNSYRVRMEIS